MNTANIFWEEETTEIIWFDWSKTEESSISTIEQTTSIDTPWQDTEVVELEPIPDITEYLLDDQDIANALNDISLNATKTVTHKDWRTEEFPNYEARLWWLKLQLKLKWHFKEKSRDNKWLNAIYQYKLK